MIKSVPGPPTNILETDQRDVTISGGKCPDQDTVLALWQGTQEWLERYILKFKTESQLNGEELTPKRFSKYGPVEIIDHVNESPSELDGCDRRNSPTIPFASKWKASRYLGSKLPS